MWKPYEIDNKFNITTFYSAFERVCDDEYFFQGEVHDFWEFVYVAGGSACIVADDRIIMLEENQLIFHKPMEFHSIRTSKDKTTELFIMSFSTEGDFMNSFDGGVFYLSSSQRRELKRVTDFIKENREYSEKEFLPTVYLEGIFKNYKKARLLKNMTENFILLLSETTPTETNLVKNTETEIYTDALNKIEEGIHEKLTIKMLAKRCNVSVAYIKKVFSKYSGLGIHEYILKNKLLLAKQLLYDGQSVTEVSEKLGFSSQNYFSTVFKRIMGLSPTEYKRGAGIDDKNI